MKRYLVLWVERYLYSPGFFQRVFSFLLLPLSALYCLIVYLKYRSAKAEDMGIKVISVGNLSVGGSGKTPLVCAIAKQFEGAAIVLRGYGRKSRGLRVVADGRKRLCDVDECGDEAMIYATKLPQNIVIVSEDRKEAIKRAKELGAHFVLLDDGYSKHSIKKLDLLIDVVSTNPFCLPSGPFREKLWRGKEAVILKEGRDFFRETHLENESKRMSLVTAIARPQRLDKYIPKVVAKHYFEDHHDFSKEEIESIIREDQPTSLLVTLKDYVKLERFGYPLSLLDLDVHISKKLMKRISAYLEEK